MVTLSMMYVILMIIPLYMSLMVSAALPVVLVNMMYPLSMVKIQLFIQLMEIIWVTSEPLRIVI